MSDSLDTALERFIALWSSGGDVSVGDYCAQFPRRRGELRERIEDFLLVAEAVSSACTLRSGSQRGLPNELTGSTVGGFSIGHELGRGGMGVVFEARPEESEQRIALKILRPDWVDTPEARERFQREARIMASLDHENCVFIHGVHDLNGVPALSMELMPGETLQDRIEADAEIDVSQAVLWTLDILAGLESVHERGIFHRDLKPGNCFLTADGRVKLGDFGLARTSDDDLRLTRDGRFLGTPVFAPPEQIRGDDIDQRSDLYAVGATLYVLLTGRYPFRGRTPEQVMARVLTDRPDPVTLVRSDVPRPLAKLLDRMLDKDPGRRPESAREVRGFLEQFVEQPMTPAHPGLRVAALFIDLFLLAGVMALISLIGCVSREEYDTKTGAISSARDPLGGPFTLEALVWAGLQIGVYTAYFGIAETRHGRTVGKWLVGLRVVAVEGRQNFWLRNSLIPATLCTPALAIAAYQAMGGQQRSMLVLLLFLGLAVWPIIASLGMRRKNGYAMLHDRISRTRVVLDRRTASRRDSPLEMPHDIATAADLQGSLDSRYQVNGKFGEILLARDLVLDRPVLLLKGTGWANESLTGDPLDRPLLIRMIRCTGTGPDKLLVLEHPGGGPLVAYLEGGGTLEWTSMHAAVADLLEEVLNGGSVPSLARLWIDRRTRLRRLPEGPSAADNLLSGDALQKTVNYLLLRSKQAPKRRPVQAPLWAETCLERLIDEPLGQTDLAEIRGTWIQLGPRARETTGRWRMRHSILGISGVVMLFAYICSFFKVSSNSTDLEWFTFVFVFFTVGMACWGVLSSILTVVTRRSLSFHLSGVGLRRSDGLPASRWRSGWRSMLFWFIVIGPLAPAARAAVAWPTASHFYSLLPLSILLVLLVAHFMRSTLRGKRSFIDLLAGTHVVPR